MRGLALLAALLAASAFAQDPASDPLPAAWDATMAAMTGELSLASRDRLGSVVFARYDVSFPGVSADRAGLTCETALPGSGETASLLDATPDDRTRAIADGLGLSRIPPEGLTRCIADLGITDPNLGPDGRAAFVDACTLLLETHGLRASPTGPAGAITGAAAPADQTVGETTLLRAACNRTAAGDTDLTLHFRGTPPNPE